DRKMPPAHQRDGFQPVQFDLTRGTWQDRPVLRIRPLRLDPAALPVSFDDLNLQRLATASHGRERFGHVERRHRFRSLLDLSPDLRAPGMLDTPDLRTRRGAGGLTSRRIDRRPLLKENAGRPRAMTGRAPIPAGPSPTRRPPE